MSVNFDAPYVRFVKQQTKDDCGVCSLAMFFGITYEDALGASVIATKDSKLHRRGLYATQLVRVAQQFNVNLVTRRTCDLETTHGLLIVEFPPDKKGDIDRHVVLLKHGTIYDPNDGTVWDAEAYVDTWKVKITSCLVIKKE